MRVELLTEEEWEYGNFPMFCLSPNEVSILEYLDNALLRHGLEVVQRSEGSSDTWISIEPVD